MAQMDHALTRNTFKYLTLSIEFLKKESLCSPGPFAAEAVKGSAGGLRESLAMGFASLVSLSLLLRFPLLLLFILFDIYI